MTDSDEEETEFPQYVRPHDEDVMLKSLAGTADDHEDFGVALTLVTAGGIVTGTLVNRKRWFDEQIEQAPDLANLVGQIGDQFEAIQVADDDKDYVFLHLINAKLFIGGVPVPESGLCWRGRVSAVSGWNFGELGPASSDE